MSSIKIPVVIESTSLVLRQDLFKKYFSEVDNPRVDLLVENIPLPAIRLRAGRENRLICRPADLAQLSSKGMAGSLVLKQGIKDVAIDVEIVLHQPHLNASPREAKWLDGFSQTLPPYVILNEPQLLVLINPQLHVRENARLSLVIDADLAMAAGIQSERGVALYYNDNRQEEKPAVKIKQQRLITENDIRKAWRTKQKISVRRDQLITPAALSLGRELKILTDK